MSKFHVAVKWGSHGYFVTGLPVTFDEADKIAKNNIERLEKRKSGKGAQPRILIMRIHREFIVSKKKKI